MPSSKRQQPTKPKASRGASTRRNPSPDAPASRKASKSEKAQKARTLTAIAEVEGDGASEHDPWTLRLYIAGDSPKSRAALDNLQRLCDAHLEGRYKIEVIDLKTRPELAKADQILALPTLIRKVPEPMKRLIGDLSNAERALIALDLGGTPPLAVRARHAD
jgi:circadian clock protein KaiB